MICTHNNVFSSNCHLINSGEKAGIASSERKNQYRTLGNEVPMQRKIMGKRGDAFVRSVGQPLTDWAASEAAAYWNGAKGTKTLRESGLVLPKQLKDIFMSLASKVDFDEKKIRAMVIAGFIHAGLYVFNVVHFSIRFLHIVQYCNRTSSHES
jgi:hypothetical protein